MWGIDQGGTLVMDGAMGTRLIGRGLDLRRDDPCLWNLSRPDEVRAIHRSDRAAGAEVFLANTFGAIRPNLDRLGAGDLWGLAIAAGVALARGEAPPEALVLGSVGPVLGPDDPDDEYRRVFDALGAAGADGIFLETFDADRAVRALAIGGAAGGLPILVSLHSWPDPPEDTLKRFEDLGAVAVGLNCVVGLAESTRLAARLHERTGLPLVVRPAAGLPGGPLELAPHWEEGLPRLLDVGVQAVGGCCGTNETHVAAIRRAVARLATPSTSRMIPMRPSPFLES